jgi:hypothetical protein
MASPWKSHLGIPFGDLPDASLFDGDAAAEARVHGWVVIDEDLRHSGDLMRPLHRRCVVVKRPDIDPDEQDILAAAKSRVSWELRFGTSDSEELERFLEWQGPEVDPSAMPNGLRPSAPGELLAAALWTIGMADAADPGKRPSEYAIGWAKSVLSHFEEPTPYGSIDLGNLEGRERVIFQLGWYLGDLAAEREIRRFWGDAPKLVDAENRRRKPLKDKAGPEWLQVGYARWKALRLQHPTWGDGRIAKQLIAEDIPYKMEKQKRVPLEQESVRKTVAGWRKTAQSSSAGDGG